LNSLIHNNYEAKFTQKPRILFIVNHFYPELGGIRIEYEIAKELAKSYEVMVITSFPRPYRLPMGFEYKEPKFKPAIIELIDGLKVLRIKSFKSKTDELKQRFIELITTLTAILMASLPLAPYYDVLLVAGAMELIVAQIGILLKVLFRKPLIVILHDIHPDVLIRLGIIKKESIIAKFFEVLIRIFSRYVDKVIVHSSMNAEILSRRYGISPEKIEVVELWANTEEIKPPNTIKEKIMLKEKFGVSSADFLVSFAGVMNPPQGLDVVIYAAKWIKDHLKENAKIKILLVGDGMEKPKLIKLSKSLGVTDIVRFLPLQPREKYVELLKASDACLVTLAKDYIQPVVPSKLLEIIAAGCPAILSMPLYSDAVKIVLNHKCGIYAGNGDPEKLAQAIVMLMKNPELQRIYSINGRRAAENYYNFHRAVKQYRSILEKIMNTKIKT